MKAAKTFRINFLPTNREIAIALDKIAEANEGANRRKRLIQIRKEALKIMKILEMYNPLLVGSVWRGTIRQGSDIDLVLYHDAASDILELLEKNAMKISGSKWVSVNKKGKTELSFHIYIISDKQEIELIVRSSEEKGRKKKCEIFGDLIRGLDFEELKRLLEENPTKKFFPQ